MDLSEHVGSTSKNGSFSRGNEVFDNGIWAVPQFQAQINTHNWMFLGIGKQTCSAGALFLSVTGERRSHQSREVRR